MLLDHGLEVVLDNVSQPDEILLLSDVEENSGDELLIDNLFPEESLHQESLVDLDQIPCFNCGDMIVNLFQGDHIRDCILNHS